MNDFFANYISLMLIVVTWIIAQTTLYRKEPLLIPLDEIDIDSESRKIYEEVWDEDEDNSKTSFLDRFWDAII